MSFFSFFLKQRGQSVNKKKLRQNKGISFGDPENINKKKIKNFLRRDRQTMSA